MIFLADFRGVLLVPSRLGVLKGLLRNLDGESFFLAEPDGIRLWVAGVGNDDKEVSADSIDDALLIGTPAAIGESTSDLELSARRFELGIGESDDIRIGF